MRMTYIKPEIEITSLSESYAVLTTLSVEKNPGTGDDNTEWGAKEGKVDEDVNEISPDWGNLWD